MKFETSTPASRTDAAKAQVKAGAARLFALHYGALRQLAERHVRRRPGAVPLTATGLVHEVYLRMVARDDGAFPDRASFFAYTSRVMHGLVIDLGRRQHAQKRGCQFELAFEEDGFVPPLTSPSPSAVSALGDALSELTRAEPELAELVDLRFFGGLSFIEIASRRCISERTVRRDWQRARSLLQRALVDENERAAAV